MQMRLDPRRPRVSPTGPDAIAVAVYGTEQARALYGELLRVPAERIVAATDGLRLCLGSCELEILDTRWHAKHHVCIRDVVTGGIFTGDVFGLSYREFDRLSDQLRDEPDPEDVADDGTRRFIVPATSPSQFDPLAMPPSIDLLLGLQPPALYLTHFGWIRAVPQLVARLRRLIDAHVAIALRDRDRGSDREASIPAGLANFCSTSCARSARLFRRSGCSG